MDVILDKFGKLLFKSQSIFLLLLCASQFFAIFFVKYVSGGREKELTSYSGGNNRFSHKNKVTNRVQP